MVKLQEQYGGKNENPCFGRCLDGVDPAWWLRHDRHRSLQRFRCQTAVVRDGRPGLVSKKKSSVVLVSPALREIGRGSRPVFTIAATNLSKQPVELRVSNITVTQTMPNGSSRNLPVIPYEQLVSEERTRQVIGALLVGAAAAGNAYSASRAGYGSYSGNVYTPRGVATVHGTYFSPTANALAQANAQAQNDAMIANVVENGQRNLSGLEQTVLKDNTVMPGEWIGGRVYFTAPEAEGDQPKSYQIAVALGDETHLIDVVQEPSAK